MNNISQTVLKQALSLAPIERAELIDKLFHSFDPNRENRIDALWSEEAESRISGYEAGKITTDSVTTVFNRLNQR